MKLIPLSKKGKNKGKYFAKVDDADYDWLNQWNWCVSGPADRLYAHRFDSQLKKHVKMHRLILGLKHGDKREGDHINHDTLDYQRLNLRILTKAENSCNRTGYGVSTYLGVCLDLSRSTPKWMAQIFKNKDNQKKKYKIGRYLSEIEAAKAYDYFADKLHGDSANLNFPKKEKGEVLPPPLKFNKSIPV